MKNRVRRSRRRSAAAWARPAWALLGLAVAATVAGAFWLQRREGAGPPADQAAADELRRQAVELIGYARSIRLSPGQQQAKSEALASITAPCGNRNSLAVGCCPCNLGKSINGLANRMIAQEGADAPKVRQAVLDWIARTNAGGYSGAACDRKLCERPFREDGCGGMREARLVG